MVVVAAVAAVIARTSSPPSAPPHDFSGRLHWIAQLVDAEPRGAVAADDSFTRELEARVEELSRTSTSPAFGARDARPPQGLRARVLFADDIGNRRIALVALQNPAVTEPRRRYSLIDLLWLAGRRGASPEALSGAVASDVTVPGSGTEYRVEGPAPFARVELGPATNPIWIALAPPECEVATAPSADLSDWQPEPTRSYLVRGSAAPAGLRVEYWRVICDGEVRELRAAPRPDPTTAELRQVQAAAVGQPDLERLGYQLFMLYETYGSELLTRPEVLWSGGVALSPNAHSASEIFISMRTDGGADAEQVDASVTVVAAPRAGGGWIGSAWTTVRTGPGALFDIDGPFFTTPTDPSGSDSLLALRLDRWRGQVLVLAPDSAASVRILNNEGFVLDESTVGDRPVMLASGEDEPLDRVRVEALDASGALVATTELVATEVRPDGVNTWETSAVGLR